MNGEGVWREMGRGVVWGWVEEREKSRQAYPPMDVMGGGGKGRKAGGGEEGNGQGMVVWK